MESGGKGRKGKKKAVNTYPGGKKGNANVQDIAAGSKNVVSTPLHATEDGSKSTRATPDRTMVKTKRKRLKKATGSMNTIVKDQVTVAETETRNASGQNVLEHSRTNSSSAVASVKSHVVSLAGGNHNKRKQNAMLSALTCTNDCGQVTKTMSLTAESPTDGKKSPLLAPLSMRKKEVVLGHSPSTATTAKKMMVAATSPKRKIEQVGKLSTKLQKQHVQKSKSVATTDNVLAAVARPRKMAKAVKTKAVVFFAGSTSMLPKDRSQLVVKSSKLKTKAQQATGVADTFRQVGSSMKGALMRQQMPHADAAITANLKDVTTKKKTIVNADSSPFPGAFDDKHATSRPAPDASTSDPVIFVKPPHTASAAANRSIIRQKPELQEPIPDETTSPPTDITKASTLAANASSPQLATARPVPPPLAKSTISGGHKRRRSIDEASTNSVTDPFQPPTKRSATVDVGGQSEASRLNKAQWPADGELAALDHLPNSPRRDTVTQQWADAPVTVRTSNESALKVVERQATLTAESTFSPSQFAAEKFDKSAPENLRCCVVQPTQLLTSMTPVEPARNDNISIAQTLAASCSDSELSAKQVELAVKAQTATSAVAPSNNRGVCAQSIAAPFESAAKTKEVDNVMDSRTYAQKMMSIDLGPSSHVNSSLAHPVESMARLPLRPPNAWGASFGMILPAHGASPHVSRTLSTTPLSSWFLSKGYANFVKQVHFSDDDDAGDGSSSEGDVPLNRRPSTSNGAEKAPQKRRASATKKNAFLELLTTQSYWRTWYGTVDLHNLLDPPLPYVLDKLLTHEVVPLPLPEPRTESGRNRPAKKMTDLESLEANIRQEKQQGLAFSEQLLMMLQGKTVSGKSLEEEYRPLLPQ